MSREKSRVLHLVERNFIDNLTSAYNRKYFNEHLKEILMKGIENNVLYTFILVNIDDFAHYNEMNGYDRGDQVLQQIGYLFKRNLRSEDYFIRYDGDEFLIVTVDTPRNEAFAVAERVRKLVEAYEFSNERIQPSGKLTVSIGMASFPEDGDSIDFLIKRADTALCHAKQRMKNRVEVFSF